MLRQLSRTVRNAALNGARSTDDIVDLSEKATEYEMEDPSERAPWYYPKIKELLDKTAIEPGKRPTEENIAIATSQLKSIRDTFRSIIAKEPSIEEQISNPRRQTAENILKSPWMFVGPKYVGTAKWIIDQERKEDLDEKVDDFRRDLSKSSVGPHDLGPAKGGRSKKSRKTKTSLKGRKRSQKKRKTYKR